MDPAFPARQAGGTTRQPRRAVRVLLVTPDERVLLMAAEDPDADPPERFWFPPGGGNEADEDARLAALREVREETGRVLEDVGVEVWRRRHVFAWRGVEHDQREQWFLKRVDAPFDVVSDAWTAEEHEELKGVRWFTLDELDAGADRLVPDDLAVRLRALLRDGPPGAPVDVGV